ncbi:protein-tyrosine-phosphatase [Flammeovirgaceae bacterium SG7u.111]|nr:protein-tyrosine-phosphatase [Flammeovirgaceae bacterium SG7u.132]WPO35704.1 protein-tyrosine-phosphatase [Flammeovirgaceae bacterium SG7u.111]
MEKRIIPLLILSLLLASCSQKKETQETSMELGNNQIKAQTPKTMYPKLLEYIDSAITGMEAIPTERKKDLDSLASYVHEKRQANEAANLIFICTHNSRRSHLSQIWAATAAYYYGIDEGIFTYSGGTEATAFNPRAVDAIQRAGFQVENPGGENPHYNVNFAEKAPSMECFSKKYSNLYNPQKNFAAIMTCSHADENCPFIPGANMRIPIPYEDPKVADGTDYEAAKYDERCLQIATEMFYMASVVKEKINL